jgi:fumarylacetoacetase
MKGHSMIDETHDPTLRSWVTSANFHADFPIQNLPLGIFTPPGAGFPRAGVAIGDMIFDLASAKAAGVFSGDAAVAAAAGPTLNALFALGDVPRQALRRRLSELLREAYEHTSKLQQLLHPAKPCTLHLPAQIADYTDF